jgi:hypothetical protein
VSTLFTFIQCSPGIPNQSSKTGRRNTRIHTGKEEVKLFLFADKMTIYLKDKENATKKS